ncbi:hypothetical protein BS78_K313200 [Paspalum vaginatum]|uniref:Uncharacterized protein n=1 Tax=Paspalum vaginatum TaxID=158149 RepID=A0A9W8CGE1_9POAL|nr:hypothetical protein BS78_K313200 [Paspalum vaginatum]
MTSIEARRPRPLPAAARPRTDLAQRRPPRHASPSGRRDAGGQQPPSSTSPTRSAALLQPPAVDRGGEQRAARRVPSRSPSPPLHERRGARPRLHLAALSVPSPLPPPPPNSQPACRCRGSRLIRTGGACRCRHSRLIRKLSDNMSLHLDTLLNSSTADFWASGLVFVMDRRQLAFMHNGQIMLDRALAPSSHHYCKILRVRSVAAPYHATINFRVVGLNLFSTSSRLICLFEGRCIFQEDTDTVADDAECEDREIDCLSFCCFVPGRRGRGVIEVEDSGFSNGFFPFVVSENDVCSEVSELEIQKSWFICNGAGVVCCDKNAVIFYLYWPC